MKLSQQSQSRIDATIRKAMERFSGGGEQSAITDIHLQIIPSTGELFIFDDDDEELSNTVINEWADYSGNEFLKDTERILSATLNRMKEDGSFEKVNILAPYSFVLVDEEKETITDLLLVDDDVMLVSEELLKGLDKELDEFLKDLLEN
ncbi:hypothetical protein LJB79_00910 [Bacteroides sp. OttesenSCG-928-M17]|nr:hypothetical protein [Bacteroides sp. OttesenSCG-928-M17]MDL2291591.1 hypothetical protein [Bacteroides sp. OttesenSCG-928-F21]